MGKLSMLYPIRKYVNTAYHYFHVKCLFKKLQHCRLTTHVIESVNEIGGLDEVSPEVRPDIEDKIFSAEVFKRS